MVAAWKGDTFKQVIKRYRTALSGRRHDCRTREVRWRPAQGRMSAAIGTAAATSPWGYYGGGYPGYYGGVYANRSYVTGRPTLVPRYSPAITRPS